MAVKSPVSKVNTVTLFSNGIGHFRRLYDVPSGTSKKISIPFKRHHIGDVAASLQVFGKVRFDSPPTFTPENADFTALNVSACESMQSLLTALSGAEIKLKLLSNNEEQGVLLGIENKSSFVNEMQVDETYIVFMTENGLVRSRAMKEVSTLEFTDEAVQAEIRKAMKKNFQRIKPDSTFLDLAISPTGNEQVEAQVQYTIPVAAWKMRYAIRQKDGAFTLEGAAVVDNNTDEDWNNFYVSVVTGNPISFATDIAQIVVPERKKVNLVDGTVLSHVDVEEGYGGLESAGGGSSRKMMRSAPQAACYSANHISSGQVGYQALNKSSLSNTASFGLMDSADAESIYRSDVGPAAESAGVDSKDVGDFCVLTCKEPISILSRRSAVVPMFSVPLNAAGVVLLYQAERSERRPYRTVKFRNESEYSLGRGKMLIYDDGIFSGECVLEATKPGENRVLPHCIENGVKVVREAKSVEQTRSSVKISSGIALDEWVSKAVTTYTIENKKDEPFKFLLEHRNMLTDCELKFSGVEVKEAEKITNGSRVYFVLEPKAEVKITATETKVNVNRITLSSYPTWLRLNVIETSEPLQKLAENKQIQACAKLQQQLDEVAASMQDLDQEVADLEEQAGRTRLNLEAGSNSKASSDIISEWINDLGQTETRIREVKKKDMPKLKTQQKKLTAELAEALQQVSATWTN